MGIKKGERIDLTDLRGSIEFQAMKVKKGDSDGGYFFINARFEDGTTVKVDMQLIELFYLNLHKAMKKDMNNEQDPIDEFMTSMMEMVTGPKVRDRILSKLC